MVPEIIPHKHHSVSMPTDTLPQGNRRNPTGCNRSREGKAPARLGPNKPKLKRDLICVSNVTLKNTVVVHQMKYGKGGTVHGTISGWDRRSTSHSETTGNQLCRWQRAAR